MSIRQQVVDVSALARLPRLALHSSHVEHGFSGGKLIVRVAIEDEEAQFTRQVEFFFSVPPDFHAHNDLVAAALMAIMGRGFREVRFNFPISAHCAATLPLYHQVEVASAVDPDLEPRRPGRFIGISFSGGLDSVGVLTLLRDVAGLAVKVITGEYEGFHREAIGYASYRRDVSCYTNFRRVVGDRGRRFDAAIPLLFADYADLASFVSGHIFGSMPLLWVDPTSDEPREFLPQDLVAEAGGLRELHIVSCLHAPSFLRFLAATAPERVPNAFFSCDGPGGRKHVMKGLMLQQAYAKLGTPAPDDITNLVLPRRPASNYVGLWEIWTWFNAPPSVAILVARRVARVNWVPIRDLALDFYWTYCPRTARLIPEEFRDALLAGFEAAGIGPSTARDYAELAQVRQFMLAINPPGTFTFEM